MSPKHDYAKSKQEAAEVFEFSELVVKGYRAIDHDNDHRVKRSEGYLLFIVQ
jgi:hypothetical protein